VAKIEVTKEYCKGCGLCIIACPKKVIEIGETTNSKGYQTAQLKAGDGCIGCQFCAITCPDSAIEVYR